jgi:hypothetical protein
MPATSTVIIICTVTTNVDPIAPTIAAILQLLISQTFHLTVRAIEDIEKEKGRSGWD